MALRATEEDENGFLLLDWLLSTLFSEEELSDSKGSVDVFKPF